MFKKGAADRPKAEEFPALDARAWASRTECDSTVFLYAFNELGEGGWIIQTPDIGTDGLTACKLTNSSVSRMRTLSSHC